MTSRKGTLTCKQYHWSVGSSRLLHMLGVELQRQKQLHTEVELYWYKSQSMSAHDLDKEIKLQNEETYRYTTW